MQDAKGIVGAATGATGAGISWLTMANEVISIIAGVLAAIASGFAIYFYIRKVLKK